MITRKEIPLFFESHRVLERGRDYIYFLPAPGLLKWISNYTLTFPGPGTISENYTVVPHGSATLVFSCDEKGIHTSLFGPVTLPCMVGEEANQADMLLIIEFQPAGLYALTGVHQKELTDQILPLETLDVILDKRIQDILYSASGLTGLIHNLDSLLLSHMRTVYPAELNLSLQNIIQNMGNITVKDISGSVYYSERHLNRMFDKYLGMGVKTFSRLVRINGALRLLNHPGCSITTVCDMSGYYDLPHFIHEFKSICGITPQEYRGRMSDFYNEIAKFSV